MANNLTPQQRDNFQGPYFDIGLIDRTGTLTDPDGIVTEITDDVEQWGVVKFNLYNLHPLQRGNPQLPFMAWTVNNESRIYTPTHPNSIWGTTSPTEWQMTLDVQERVTPEILGSPYPLSNLTFQVLEVQLTGTRATILGTSRFQFLLDRTWLDTDGSDVDFSGVAGNSVIIGP